MPWKIVENHEGCPSDKPYAVVKESDDSVAGCHPTRTDANEQLKALYVNVKESQLTETFSLTEPQKAGNEHHIHASEEMDVLHSHPAKAADHAHAKGQKHSHGPDGVPHSHVFGGPMHWHPGGVIITAGFPHPEPDADDAGGASDHDADDSTASTPSVTASVFTSVFATTPQRKGNDPHTHAGEPDVVHSHPFKADGHGHSAGTIHQHAPDGAQGHEHESGASVHWHPGGLVVTTPEHDGQHPESDEVAKVTANFAIEGVDQNVHGHVPDIIHTHASGTDDHAHPSGGAHTHDSGVNTDSDEGNEENTVNKGGPDIDEVNEGADEANEGGADIDEAINPVKAHSHPNGGSDHDHVGSAGTLYRDGDGTIVAAAQEDLALVGLGKDVHGHAPDVIHDHDGGKVDHNHPTGKDHSHADGTDHAHDNGAIDHEHGATGGDDTIDGVDPKEPDADDKKYTANVDTFASVSDQPWDGAASRFTDEQWKKATAACDGEGSVKETCFLPHHEPSGTVSRAGVHNAAARFNQVQKGNKDAAKSHLRGHYTRDLKEEVPDVLEASATTAVFNGNTTGNLQLISNTGYVSSTNLGPWMTFTTSTEIPAGNATAAPQRWKATLILTDIPTGDGRFIDNGALKARPLPLPLMMLKETTEGHQGAVLCGQIDKVYTEGNRVMGEGTFDSGPEGQEADRLVGNQMLRWVSADLEIADYSFEFTGENCDQDGSEGSGLEALFGPPEGCDMLFKVHDGAVMGATLVPFPAFPDATIELMDDAAIAASAATDCSECALETSEKTGGLRFALFGRSDGEDTANALVAAAVTPPDEPPAAWFANPALTGPTALVITDEGYIYGHLAEWGTCHTASPQGKGVCTVAPSSRTNYAYFMTGAVRTSDGTDVAVGQITLDTGHAPGFFNPRDTVAHYDNTGTAVADVAVGEDAYGIWVAGALRPGIGELDVRKLRGASLSGDWRPLGGSLELVAALAVNVPGFPVPRPMARVASGKQLALVAAGIVQPPEIRLTQLVEDLQQAYSQNSESFAVLAKRVAELEQAFAAADKVLEPIRGEQVEKLKAAIKK